MRFRVRTLLIVLTIAPPLLAGLWLATIAVWRLAFPPQLGVDLSNGIEIVYPAERKMDEEAFLRSMREAEAILANAPANEEPVLGYPLGAVSTPTSNQGQSVTDAYHRP
jgi:hypothetical protein